MMPNDTTDKLEPTEMNDIWRRVIGSYVDNREQGRFLRQVVQAVAF